MAEPLNLRKSLIERFWNEQDPRMARILRWMDNTEKWMLDERPDVLQALTALSQSMSKSSPAALADRFDPLLDVLAYMSSSRALRIIEWMDRNYAGGLSLRLVERALERPDERAQLLIDRLQTLRSLSVLGKIFAESRIKRAIHILKQDSNSEQTPS